MFRFFYSLVLLGLVPTVLAASQVLDYGVLRMGEDYTLEADLAWEAPTAILLEATTDCECLTVEVLPDELETGAANRIVFAYKPNATGVTKIQVKLTLVPDGAQKTQAHAVSFVAFIAEQEATMPWDGAMVPADIPSLKPEQVGARLMAWTLVDIRGLTAYNEMRIPGSLQYGLDNLRYQHGMDKAEIVLVDNGWFTAAQQGIIRRMQADGFSIARIEGGIAGWMRSGGDVQGDWVSMLAANQVSLREWVEVASPEWRVIDLSAKSQPRAPSYLWGQKVHFDPLMQDSAEHEAYVTRLLEDAFRDPQCKALLIIGDKPAYTRVAGYLREKSPLPVRFLGEGADGARQWVARLHEPADARTHRMSWTTGSGAPAPGATPSTFKPTNTGCSTCPGR